MSSRLPNGVATTYSVPGRTAPPRRFVDPPPTGPPSAGFGGISQPEERLDALAQELHPLDLGRCRSTFAGAPPLVLRRLPLGDDLTQLTEQRGIGDHGLAKG